jgi:hypothetical protein
MFCHERERGRGCCMPGGSAVTRKSGWARNQARQNMVILRCLFLNAGVVSYDTVTC